MNDLTIHCEGKIKNWDHEKGYGFISSSLGNLYTHISAVKNREELKPGQRVRFCIESSECGLIAKSVERI